MNSMTKTSNSCHDMVEEMIFWGVASTFCIQHMMKMVAAMNFVFQMHSQNATSQMGVCDIFWFLDGNHG